MPTLIERFRLAHAVLQRQTGEEPAIELDETMSQAECSEPQSLHDSILEELGLVGERDDSVDLDIIPDPE